MRSLTPVRVIAADICADLGDSVNRFQYSLTRKILEGYRDLHLFVDQDFCVKTAVLECDNVIDMPSDFIYETKVGIMCNGRLAAMSLDKEIRREMLTQSQTQVQLDAIFNGQFTGLEYSFYNAYRNGSYLGELYGLGGNFNTHGFYNIDRKAGQILIGSLVPEGAEIVVEYKSDGVSDGLELVPTELVTALKFYAQAEHYMSKNLGLYQLNRERYLSEYYKVKKTYNFRDALFMSSEIQSHQRPTVHTG